MQEFQSLIYCAFSWVLRRATITLMKKWTLCLALVLLLGSRVAFAQDSAGLMGRINELRASLGLPAYAWNGALAAAAQSQAQWMVDSGTIAHARPDGSTPRTRALAAGYTTTEVSENIYGGTNATPNDAWTFWINSAIHYAGLTNARYKEVGVGIASGSWGSAYVLVFGNPGGAAYVPPAAGTGNSGGGGSASNAPPSYVVGLDTHGNIMHEIQPGDTLGDIALIYGYTWADIPTMVALNGLNQEDYRDLEVGSIFLVPPKNGTYTPTPGDAPTSTPEPATATATPEPATLTPPPSPSPALTESPAPTPSPVVIAATANSVPEQVQILVPTHLPTVTPAAVALVNTPAGDSSGVTITANTSPPLWLIVGLLVQVGVLLVAGIELVRRMRRR